MKTLLFLTLASCGTTSLVNAATLANRWSFDTDTTDSVGGNTGTLNNGATVSAGNLVLAGTGTSTGGNHMGFTSSLAIGATHGASGVTIESWYTDTGTGTWGKLFQFGNNVAGEELAYTHTRGNGEMSGVDRNGSQLLGEQVSQNFQHDLSNVNTTFEGIGATSWGDPGMTGTVDEFRIYSGELSAGEVTANFAAGPNTIIPEPSGLALVLVGSLLTIRRRRA